MLPEQTNPASPPVNENVPEQRPAFVHATMHRGAVHAMFEQAALPTVHAELHERAPGAHVTLTHVACALQSIRQSRPGAHTALFAHAPAGPAAQSMLQAPAVHVIPAPVHAAHASLPASATPSGSSASGALVSEAASAPAPASVTELDPSFVTSLRRGVARVVSAREPFEVVAARGERSDGCDRGEHGGDPPETSLSQAFHAHHACPESRRNAAFADSTGTGRIFAIVVVTAGAGDVAIR